MKLAWRLGRVGGASQPYWAPAPRVAGAWERGELFFPAKKERGSNNRAAEKARASVEVAQEREREKTWQGHEHEIISRGRKTRSLGYNYSKYFRYLYSEQTYVGYSDRTLGLSFSRTDTQIQTDSVSLSFHKHAGVKESMQPILFWSLQNTLARLGSQMPSWLQFNWTHFGPFPAALNNWNTNLQHIK